MEFAYIELKKYLEEQLKNIEYYKKDKKQQKKFYSGACGAVEFAMRMAESSRIKGATQKVSLLWNCDIMPKMNEAIWG